MYKGRCDCCQRCYATNQIWVHARNNIMAQIDLCKGCTEIADNEDLKAIADYVLTKDKVQFLRNMPKTIEEELEEMEYKYQQEKAENKELQKKIDELEEWDEKKW